MKFVSKNSNLGIVLKPGIQGNSQLGTATVSGVFARFKDGVLTTEDPWMIERLLTHAGFNIDYFPVEEGSSDPYLSSRVSSEPTHILSNIKNGHPERVTKTPVNMTPEMKKALMEMATEMAKPMAIELSKQMLPSMVTEVLRTISEKGAGSDYTTTPEAPRKAGRPKKVISE